MPTNKKLRRRAATGIQRKTERIRNGYGGFLLTFEPQRAEWLSERLGMELSLSQSFSSQDWEMARRELMFLVLPSHSSLSIRAFVLMEKVRGTGGFATLKMRFAKLLVFSEPVHLLDIGVPGLDERISTPGAMERLDEFAWADLVDQVKRLLPHHVADLDAIVAARDEEHRLLGDSERILRLNEQRDGLGLALDIGMLDRAAVLRSVNVEQAARANSILDLLDNAAPIQERSLLEHDKSLFEKILGGKSFRSASFSEGLSHSVRVLVTDQSDLETVLGTDLIIYNTRYKSFLFLQYKKMIRTENAWSFPIPPSSNLWQQLEQMGKFRATAERSSASTPSALSSLWNYRMSDDPCYFKFCEQFRPSSQDANLVPGITMPALYLEQFLALPEAKGIRGGISVGYKNCPRYLNNTEFVQLARAGWIGGGKKTAVLLEELLSANRRESREGMLAIVDVPMNASASERSWRS